MTNQCTCSIGYFGMERSSHGVQGSAMLGLIGTPQSSQRCLRGVLVWVPQGAGGRVCGHWGARHTRNM